MLSDGSEINGLRAFAVFAAFRTGSWRSILQPNSSVIMDHRWNTMVMKNNGDICYSLLVDHSRYFVLDSIIQEIDKCRPFYQITNNY